MSKLDLSSLQTKEGENEKISLDVDNSQISEEQSLQPKISLSELKAAGSGSAQNIQQEEEKIPSAQEEDSALVQDEQPSIEEENISIFNISDSTKNEEIENSDKKIEIFPNFNPLAEFGEIEIESNDKKTLKSSTDNVDIKERIKESMEKEIIKGEIKVEKINDIILDESQALGQQEVKIEEAIKEEIKTEKAEEIKINEGQVLGQQEVKIDIPEKSIQNKDQIKAQLSKTRTIPGISAFNKKRLVGGVTFLALSGFIVFGFLFSGSNNIGKINTLENNIKSPTPVVQNNTTPVVPIVEKENVTDENLDNTDFTSENNTTPVAPIVEKENVTDEKDAVNVKENLDNTGTIVENNTNPVVPVVDETENMTNTGTDSTIINEQKTYVKGVDFIITKNTKKNIKKVN